MIDSGSVHCPRTCGKAYCLFFVSRRAACAQSGLDLVCDGSLERYVRRGSLRDDPVTDIMGSARSIQAKIYGGVLGPCSTEGPIQRGWKRRV